MKTLLLSAVIASVLIDVIAIIDSYRFPTPAPGGISEVASMKATKSTSGDSDTLAFPNNVTSGNMLVVGGAAWTSTQSTSVAVTDTLGTTYTVEMRAPPGVNWVIWIAYGVAGSSGSNTITVNPQGATSDFSFAIDAFTGVVAVDVASGTSNSQFTTTPSFDRTTVATNTLLLGVMSHDSGTTTLEPGATYTQIGESENNSTNQCFSFIYKILSAAGANTILWSAGATIASDTYGLSLKGVE